MPADSSIPIPTREIRTVGPKPEADRLRAAYLGLLKLCLCDLAGAGTISVGRTDDGEVFSRELAGEQLQLRTNGMDWPLNGLSMAGLARLHDLQSCVESVVAEGVPGDLIEAGAWRGGASLLMRATLDCLGADERTVWVADSFRGFPSGDGEDAPQDAKGDDLGVFDFLVVPLEEVRGYFARFGCEQGVNFVPGLFEETMPRLRDRRWSVVRLDGDTYEATWVTLQSLYPGLSTGGHLIVDDYGALEECRRAVDDFRREHAIAEPLEEVDWTCVRWRRESGTPVSAGKRGREPGDATRARTARVIGPRQETRVPTVHELKLERELAELRERLQAAESESLAASSPRRSVVRAWRKLRGGGA